MAQGGFSLKDRLEAQDSQGLHQPGAQMPAEKKDKKKRGSLDKKKTDLLRKATGSSRVPVDNISNGGHRDRRAAASSGVQRGRAAGSGASRLASLDRPKLQAAPLKAEVVGTGHGGGRRKPKAPNKWPKAPSSSPSNAAAGLAAVADTESAYEFNGDDDGDASFGGQPGSVRDSNPTAYRGGANTAPKPRNQRRSEALKGGAKRVAPEGASGSHRRVTRRAANGDQSKLWGNGGDGDYKPTTRRVRPPPAEMSPASKREQEARKRLQQQGKDSSEAITLSSSDEETEEVADEAGTFSFALDDDKIFFGREAKDAKGQDGKSRKVQFLAAGLRLPAIDIWGGGEGDDVVPYDEIEHIHYNLGKHVFLSVTLHHAARKLRVVNKKNPLLETKQTKYTDMSRTRILVPLRENQRQLFEERKESIVADLIAQVVLEEDDFLVPVKPFQVNDLLEGTPYKTRRRTRASAGAATRNPADAERLMAYYPDHGKNRVKITQADLNVLGEYEMLNDSIIDFYLKWIEHEFLSQQPELASQFLFFGTFFFKKMITQVSKANSSKHTLLDRLASVEKYNSRGGQSIWDYRYLFVPINDAFHWSLAVVCIAPQQATVPTADQAAKGSETVSPPHIDVLYFDSLGHKGRKHTGKIIQYLNYKWNKEHHPSMEGQELSKVPYELRAAKKRKSSKYFSPQSSDDDGSGEEEEEEECKFVNLVEKKAPNQENGHDCGVFLLEYSERFVKDVMFRHAKGADTERYIGCSDFQTWFDNEAIGEKRNRMKQLLDHLDKKRETSERMEELKLQMEQVEKKGGDGQEKKAKALEAMTTLLGQAAPKPALEVFLCLRGQDRKKQRQRSFKLDQAEVAADDGMGALLAKFTEWAKKSLEIDVGDELRLYKDVRQFSILGQKFAGDVELEDENELDLSKSPEANLLCWGDHIFVVSAAYDKLQAEQHATAETISDDEDDDEDMQVAAASVVDGKGGKGSGGRSGRGSGRNGAKRGSGEGGGPAQKIPKKASKNDKGAKKPPPLPQQRSSEEKRRSSSLSSVADKARGGGGDASGDGAQGDSDVPDWVNEQAEQREQRRSRKRSSDTDSDSEEEDSPAAGGKRARGGESPKVPVTYSRYGAAQGQGSPVQRLPPGVGKRG